jgi:hypothetical protein
MSKKTIRVVAAETAVTYAEFSIDEFLRIINDAKSNGATKVEFDSEVNWDTPSCNMTCSYEREETDAEYQQRIINERQDKEHQRFYALKEIERLKKIIGE